MWRCSDVLREIFLSLAVKCFTLFCSSASKCVRVLSGRGRWVHQNLFEESSRKKCAELVLKRAKISCNCLQWLLLLFYWRIWNIYSLLVLIKHLLYIYKIQSSNFIVERDVVPEKIRTRKKGWNRWCRFYMWCCDQSGSTLPVRLSWLCCPGGSTGTWTRSWQRSKEQRGENVPASEEKQCSCYTLHTVLL